jgi:sugar phosphate isomerase/epimerase
MPEIGLSMLYSLSEPFQKMTEWLPKSEIAYVEIVDDGLHALDRQRVAILKNIRDSYDLKYSVHAPFADINIASPSSQMLAAMLKRLEESMMNAQTLDAYMWIFHPGIRSGISSFYPGMDWLQNQKTVKTLLRLAENYGLKIAIENVPEPYPFLMKSVDDFSKFFNEIGEDIGIVLDVGHSNINGQTELFLETFTDKIVHMHLSDNNGEADQHLGIGYGTVNWKRITDMIKETSYKGVAVIEAIEHVKESAQRLKHFLG